MSTTKSFARAAILAGAIAVAGFAGGSAPAEAAGFTNFSGLKSNVEQSNVLKVGHRRHKHRRFRFGFRKKHHGHGCGFYKWKWHETGFFYWKKKYYICKGWW